MCLRWDAIHTGSSDLHVLLSRLPGAEKYSAFESIVLYQERRGTEEFKFGGPKQTFARAAC